MVTLAALEDTGREDENGIRKPVGGFVGKEQWCLS